MCIKAILYLFKQMIQGRGGKKNLKTAKPEGQQAFQKYGKYCDLLDSDGGLELFIPDKEQRSSLFVTFKGLFSLQDLEVWLYSHNTQVKEG